MALKEFAPPGRVDDLTAKGRKRWSAHISDTLTAGAAGNPGVPNDSPRPQFFNPLGVKLATDAARKAMRWGAFPRKLARLPQPQRWTLGEDRNRQEEYCEWAAERDSKGRIIRAMFTTEVPEYYALLGSDDPDALVALYQQHVSPDVRRKDLFSGKTYRPQNRWNLAGAMHMIQPNNTLGAAVLLVAQASIVRRNGAGGVMANANELIRCGVNADIDRNSDPLIVGDVNGLARLGAAVTFDDPAGLYLDRLTTPGWKTPDGADPRSFWKVTRGEAGHAVRAVYEVPKSRKYTVSDITISGRPIASPSQIAEFIQVRVTGLAHGFGKHNQAPRRCNNEPADDGLESLAPAAVDEPSVEELLAAARSSR